MKQSVTAQLFFLLTAACFLLICEGANIKIINGDEVVPHSRPYMAVIQTTDGKSTFICGGSLIQSDWVLTAAHCDLIAGKTTVTLGAHSRTRKEPEKQEIKVIKFYVYKPFNATTLRHDIQLVQLSKKANLGTAVGTLQLPETYKDPKKDTVCRVAGWGRTETGVLSDKLMETNIRIQDRKKCKKLWKGEYSITTDMLCTNVGANGKASCQGDSGGPLICGGVFLGVLSFGHIPCGCPETSNVFTRLTKKYVKWIKKTISQNSSERRSKEK